jgi:hypothetical protein
MPRSPIRARDLRVSIQELGFEKAIVTTLEELLEQQSADRVNFRQMAEMLDTCINELQKLVYIGTSMRSTIDQLKRDQNGE